MKSEDLKLKLIHYEMNRFKKDLEIGLKAEREAGDILMEKG